MLRLIFDTCEAQKPPVIYDRLRVRVGIAGIYSRDPPTAGIYDTMGYETVEADAHSYVYSLYG